MPRYAVLLKANANRVYGSAAFDLARAELAALDRGPLDGVVAAAERGTVAGVDYLLLDTPAPLEARSVDLLSNLSSLHALFGV